MRLPEVPSLRKHRPGGKDGWGLLQPAGLGETKTSVQWGKPERSSTNLISLNKGDRKKKEPKHGGKKSFLR